MEKSTNYSFNLPNSANDEIADINDISDNFRIIDEKLKIDQTFSKTSENPQSGKAIAGEMGKKQDYFADISDSSQNRDINLTDKNGTVVGQIVVVPTEGIRYTNVLTPENDTHGVNKKYVDDTSNNVKSYVNNNFANALKGSKSGSAILIDDVSPVTHDMGVKISNKNSIPYPYSKTTQTVNGVTFTDNGDGTINVNGTATANTLFYLNAIGLNIGTGTFTLSGCPSGGTSSTYSIRIANGLSTYNKFYRDIGLGVKVTSTEQDGWFIALNIFADVTVENLVFKPQLELGITPTAYTPYVSDLTAVKVKKQGKNLFDKDAEKHNVILNGETIVAKSNYRTIFIDIERISDFVLSVYNSSGNMYWGVCDSIEVGSTIFSKGILNNTHQGIITNNSHKFVGVSCYCSDITIFNLVQLELGTTATEYEPYITPTEYTPTADGVVNGVTSLYPNTTLTTDTNGVMIDCEYNRDINKAFAELQQAIISLGGNV